MFFRNTHGILGRCALAGAATQEDLTSKPRRSNRKWGPYTIIKASGHDRAHEPMFL